MMAFSLNLVALFFLSLLTTTCSSTTIGVTYNPSSSSSITSLPTPEHVVSILQSLHIPAVNLLDPTPAAIRAFAYSNISLLLTIPNSLISSFAANRSTSTEWLYSHVLPYYPRVCISLISLGYDVASSSSSSSLDPTSDPSTLLLPAMRNFNRSLRDLGIKNIAISTTFSYINLMSKLFPPSTAEFQQPIDDLLVKPVLEFLDDQSNSSFLIDIFPYDVYNLQRDIPIGFAIFQESPFDFRDDDITVLRYRNLFDVMVDGVVAALANSGHESIRLIVTATGWPITTSSSPSGSGGNSVGTEATQAFAEIYLKGLISHLKCGIGTPLRKDGLAEVYIYELFDEENENSPVMNSSNLSGGRSAGGNHWGIMYPNMTMKFNLEFSGSKRASGINWVMFFLGVMTGIVILAAGSALEFLVNFFLSVNSEMM